MEQKTARRIARMINNRTKNKEIEATQKKKRQNGNYTDHDGQVRHQGRLDRMAKLLHLANVRDIVGDDAWGDVVKDTFRRKVL